MTVLVTYGKASNELSQSILGRVQKSPVLEDRHKTVLAVKDVAAYDLTGYAGVISTQSVALSVPGVFALSSIDHLEDGDVVLMQPSGMVRTLYRRSSRHNAIFATDRCNSLCLMCSQPPRDVDDQHLVSPPTPSTN